MAQVLYLADHMAKKKLETEKSNAAPASAGMLYSVRNELSAKITSNEIAIKALGEKLDAKLDALDAKWSNKIEEIDTKWDSKMAAMDTKWDSKMAAMDTKWDSKMAAMDAKWDRRMAEMEAKWEAKLSRMLFFYEEQKNDNRYTRDLLVALEARQDRLENTVNEIKTLLDV